MTGSLLEMDRIDRFERVDDNFRSILLGRHRSILRSGRLAQLGERRVRNAEAGGSIPPPSTNLYALSVSWCPGVFVVSAADQNSDQTFHPETDFELQYWMAEDADCEGLGPSRPSGLVSCRSEFPRPHSIRARASQASGRFNSLDLGYASRVVDFEA
jgi:hypothetical protein